MGSSSSKADEPIVEVVSGAGGTVELTQRLKKKAQDYYAKIQNAGYSGEKDLLMQFLQNLAEKNESAAHLKLRDIMLRRNVRLIPVLASLRTERIKDASIMAKAILCYLESGIK